jgi:hypothetical protein
MWKWVDRGLSLLLILGGIGHTYGVLSFYKEPHALFWSLTDSALVFLLAAINLLRSWRADDRALATVAAAGCVANLAIAVGVGRLISDMLAFPVLLMGSLSLGLLLFSVRDALGKTVRS